MGTTAIIILSYNNVKDTINCIKSVKEFNTALIKFIVVDNGSPDRTIIRDLRNELEHISAQDFKEFLGVESIEHIDLPYISLISSRENGGYAKGNNLGLELAYKDPSIEYIMILNNDILFVEDIIPKLISDISEEVAIVSPVLYKKGLLEIDTNCARKSVSNMELIMMHFPYPIDPLKISRNRKLLIENNSGLMAIELPSGSCMLSKKDKFQEIGGFDPNTFLYFEEDILWERIKSHNYINYIDTSLRCIHLGASSTKKSPSRFIVNTSVSSAQYLLNAYRSPTYFQKFLMSSFKILTDWRMRLIESFSKK